MYSLTKPVHTPKNKRTYILFLVSTFTCTILGFLSSLVLKFSYQEIRTIEVENTHFLALKLSLFSAFLLGFTLKRILHVIYETYLELAIIILLIFEIFTISKSSSQILQVDYIFYTSLFQFFVFLDFFSIGYFISSLRKVRLWGFLIGSITFFVYLQTQKEIELNSFNYIIPTLTLLVIEICLSSFLSWANKVFIQKKLSVKREINDVFFYAALTLFLTHCLLYYYRVTNGPDALFVGGGLGLLLFNIFRNLQLSQKYLKISFLVGRTVVILNLVLTLNQSYLENYYFLLFFLDLATIEYFRPKKLRKTYSLIAFISGIGIPYLSYELHLKYIKIEFLYSFVLVIVNLVWIPLTFKNNLGVINKILTLLVSLFLCSYFFSPLPVLYEVNFSPKQENIDPIPFTFTGLSFNEDEYVFYNTNLPFYNFPMLPKKRDFKNKIVVVEIKKNPELVLTYIKYLDKNGYPYLIFQSKNFSILSNEGLNFSYIEYPLFRVYYSKNGLEGKKLFNPLERTQQNWENEYIESKYRNLTSNEEILAALDQVISYSSYELAKKAKEHKLLFFESYKKYLEYHYKNGNYNLTINLASLVLKFYSEDPETLNITYNALLNTTPEPSHIELMDKLLKYPEYKEMILKRLYPILLAYGKENEALSKLEELISIYKSENKAYSEIEKLYLEKVKIFVKNNKFYEAEDLIKKELARAPNSPAWQKLANDVKYLKETTYKPYYYYLQNKEKNKDEVLEQ